MRIHPGFVARGAFNQGCFLLFNPPTSTNTHHHPTPPPRGLEKRGKRRWGWGGSDKWRTSGPFHFTCWWREAGTGCDHWRRFRGGVLRPASAAFSGRPPSDASGVTKHERKQATWWSGVVGGDSKASSVAVVAVRAAGGCAEEHKRSASAVRRFQGDGPPRKTPEGGFGGEITGH